MHSVESKLYTHYIHHTKQHAPSLIG